MGDSSLGRKYVTAIGLYMVVKSILNLVLGFSVQNAVNIVINGALAYFMMKSHKFSNIVAAVLLAVVALMNLGNNISGLPGTTIYLIEGVIDLSAAALLLFNKDIKSHFE